MSAWSYDAFRTPGAAVFDRERQQVAAVSRAPGNLDLFVIGFDNRIWTTFWNEGGWSPDWFPVPGAAVFDRERQHVAAVSRAPGNLDLFVIGFDNRIWTTFWNEGGWSPDWFPVPGAAVFDRERQHVAAVSRAPGNLDLFVIGFDNRIWTTFWNEGGWSPDWFPVPGAAVFDRERQHVAAVSRAPGNLDLFVIGFDNRIWTTFWNEGGWSPDWFPVPGAAVFDRERQHVAAVSRAPGNLDLFVIGFDNRIWTTFWNEGGWSPDWFPVPGAAVFDRERQHVAAVSRAPGNLDLFVIGFDNRIWTTFWNEGGWSPDWFPVPGAAVFDRERQHVAAVSRAPGNLDLFVIGFDNRIWTAYWGATNTTVTHLIDSGPLGAKLTVVVVGDGFAIGDQHAYNDAVDALLTNGLFAHDFFSEHRSAFNLLRINVVSTDSGVTTKTYGADGHLKATTSRDSALGMAYNGEWAHGWVEDGPDTVTRLTRLLSDWAPEHSLVLVLLNNPGFGGSGGGGRIALPLGVSWSTVAHEFGHALGGLADEYHSRDGAYTAGEPPEPNVTTNTAAGSLKWGWAIAHGTPVPTGAEDYPPPKPAGWDDNQNVGLFEGGAGDFATGIYRPVVNCRMRTNEPPFCPVCSAAMRAKTVPHQSAPHAEGPHPAESYLRMLVRVEGDSVAVVAAHEIDGPLVLLDAVTHGITHELLVNGERVAVGSNPDAGIVRTFTDIQAGGLRGHNTRRLDTYEFPLRVPASALRGVRAADVTINVLTVQAPSIGALQARASLHDDPDVATALIATTNLGEASLPPDIERTLARE